MKQGGGKGILASAAVLVIAALCTFPVEISTDALLRDRQQSKNRPAPVTSDRNARRDQYGGLSGMPSPNPATGWFRTEKFENRWLFVDPDNNAYWLAGVFGVGPDQTPDDRGNTAYATLTRKYAASPIAWADAELQRLIAWGFNANFQSSVYTYPVLHQAEWSGDGYIPTKLPFLHKYMNSHYAMANTFSYLPEGVKDFQWTIDRRFDVNWIPPGGEADYYDPKLWTHLRSMIQQDGFLTWFKQAPLSHRKYLLGISTDESDQTYSFDVGPDFPTEPEAGHNHANGAYRVAICSPIQTANKSQGKGFVYSDTAVYIKLAWRDYLKAVYGTTDALNAAWGATYTTFGSTGIPRNEVVGTGDGSTRTFSVRLADRVVTRYTLQIAAGETAVAGDLGNGTVWGPNVTGTIDYTTGRLTLAFALAPARDVVISAKYVQNGWGIGAGLLDEDGRHRTWMGNDSVRLAGMSPATRKDIENFLYEITKHYLQQGRAVVNAYFRFRPLFTGTDMWGGYSVPGPCPVLRAAGQFADFIVLNANNGMTQAQVDFVRSCYGDRPFVQTNFTTANTDSALFRHVGPGATAFENQRARGIAYENNVANLLNAKSGGAHPVAGMVWFRLFDDWPEKMNFGLVTALDNAYDGHEAAAKRVPCSEPLRNFQCGGEERDYGDVISNVRRANRHAQQVVLRAR